MIFERIAPEQNDSLPDVPEPSENPRLFGHDEAVGKLAFAYRSGTLHHGLLFTGQQGIGKATLAFHLAHHVLKHPAPAGAPETLATPDPSSSLFRMIAQGAHPGVLHLTRPPNKDGKGFKTVLTVDEVRRVSRFLSMTAHDGGYRVVIVDPAEDMNTNAANALLKNLEEPPARSLFILISHQPGRLLPTIRSRCQVVKLAPLSDSDLRAVLGSFQGGAPNDGALAQRAGGSARNAVLLTQYGGLEIADVVDRLLAGQSFNIAEAHKLADAVSGRDQAIQFGIFNRHVLDRLAVAAAEAASAGEIAGAEQFSRLWQQTSAAITDTETYNLDKKQHVVGLLHRLHPVMNRTAPARAAG